MFASVTRVRVRSVRYLPAFVWQIFLSQRQVMRAPGFCGGRLLADAGRTFWTLTVWESDQAMKAFRGSAAHAKVMPRLAEWCDEAANAHWTASADTVPLWPEAHKHLTEEGRLSPVAHPSPGHEARAFPKPRVTLFTAMDLKPAGASK